MNVSLHKITLEFDENELRVIYYALKHAIQDSIKDHWVHHPDAYKKMEAERLNMVVTLGRIVGNDVDVRADLFKELTDAIAKTPSK